MLLRRQPNCYGTKAPCNRSGAVAYSATTHLAKFKGEAGSEAARNAIEASEGRRIPSGTYAVIFGPQPVNDLMVNLILPSLSADTFYACRSAFLGEIGRPIASKLLTVYDHGAARGMAGSKRITCEGLPTGRISSSAFNYKRMIVRLVPVPTHRPASY